MLVAAGGLVFPAPVWIGLPFHLEQRREGEVAQARRDVLNLSIAPAEQVSRLIEGVDLVMRLIQADDADDPKAFDLVLMDVQMPGMDGITATRMIRRLKGPFGERAGDRDDRQRAARRGAPVPRGRHGRPRRQAVPSGGALRHRRAPAFGPGWRRGCRSGAPGG